MTSRVGWVVVTTLFVLALGAATAGAQAPERECERNGGYWVTATGHCKIGA